MRFMNVVRDDIIIIVTIIISVVFVIIHVTIYLAFKKKIFSTSFEKK